MKNKKTWVGEGRLGKSQLHWLHRLQTPCNGYPDRLPQHMNTISIHLVLLNVTFLLFVLLFFNFFVLLKIL